LNFLSHKYIIHFFAIITVALVWVFPYYVTGDGGCHLYNATILNDYFHHRNTDFYNQFYTASEHVSPNWFTHYFLVACMQVFSPMVSEKILISLCILLMLYGFKKLLLQLGYNQVLCLLLFIPFVFQAAFFKGFYNYMCSIGLYFYLLSYYLKHKNNLQTKHLLWLCFSMIGLYIVHLIGLLLLYISIGITVLYDYYLSKGKNISSLFKIILVCVPSFLLCIYFALKFQTEYIKETIPYIQYAKNLLTLNCLHTHHAAEKYGALFLAVFIISIAIYEVYKSAKTLLKEKLIVVFGIQLIVLFLFYFFIPENLFGGGIIHTRIEALLYIFIIILISILLKNKNEHIFFQMIAFSFCVFFIGIKIPSYIKGNKMMGTLMENEKFIKEKSVLLPLSFEHSGILNNAEITDNTHFYGTHCSEYLGATKPLIFTDNYEAISGLFPLTWQKGKDPFMQLTANNKLEDERPEITLSNYTTQVDTIDYILLFNMNQSARQSAAYKNIIDSTSMHYSLIHQNKDSSIQLFKNNSK
jgi:hypothetical protein